MTTMCTKPTDSKNLVIEYMRAQTFVRYAVRFAWASGFLMCTKVVCLRLTKCYRILPTITLCELRNLFQHFHVYALFFMQTAKLSS